MVTIYIDGKKCKVNESYNLLKACLTLGYNVPYFCWHPALGSIGACRQCAVKKYQNIKDTSGQIIMSCMTPIVEDMIISIHDNESITFRKNIIEFLMINHPHDCPICEEGGHCHLQDMTVMTGQNFRRYRFNKRIYKNQYLGSFISHKMNRCISCYRCIRYYKDYADGNDLGVYGIHDNLYFGRTKDGNLSSEFSGNLVEICPTGVFIDKTHSVRYNRKWDMQFAPSICQQCSVGCNISPGERYGELRRIENRYNKNVNHHFICDLGRFGYGYVNLENRPRQPVKLHEGKKIILNTNTAIKSAVNILHNAKNIIGIGSPRASIESNFALRQLVGESNFYVGIGEKEHRIMQIILDVLTNSGIRTPSLKEIESYDAILILGEDITQTGMRIALSVRQAIKGKSRYIAKKNKIEEWNACAIKNVGQNAKYPLFITNVDRTRLDDVSTWSYYASVNDQAILGFEIAHKIDNSAPTIININNSLKDKVNMISNALITAKRPLIISGSHSGSDIIINAATNIALALKKKNNNVGITFVVSAVNSIGITMLGGGNLDQALDKIENNKSDGAIILENDIYRNTSNIRIQSALNNMNYLIVLDHQKTLIQEKANLILSSSSFAEGSGTVVNNEGRAQRFFQVYDPTYYNKNIIILDSWQWLYKIQSVYNKKLLDCKLDFVINDVIKNIPKLSGIKYASPDANFRINGQKIPRSPHCYSGRTSINSNINIHETQTPQDKNTMFTFSMEGSNSLVSKKTKQIAFLWSPGWNSPNVLNKFQDILNEEVSTEDYGVRLIKSKKKLLNYFIKIPSYLLYASKNQWTIAPYWHMFGSEETSQKSLVIKKNIPISYAMINQYDALKLNIKTNDVIIFTCLGMQFSLLVKFSKNLSSRYIGLPLGFPGIPTILAGEAVTHLKIYSKEKF